MVARLTRFPAVMGNDTMEVFGGCNHPRRPWFSNPQIGSSLLDRILMHHWHRGMGVRNGMLACQSRIRVRLGVRVIMEHMGL